MTNFDFLKDKTSAPYPFTFWGLFRGQVRQKNTAFWCPFIQERNEKVDIMDIGRKGGESFAAFMEYALKKVNFYIIIA